MVVINRPPVGLLRDDWNDILDECPDLFDPIIDPFNRNEFPQLKRRQRTGRLCSYDRGRHLTRSGLCMRCEKTNARRNRR